MTQTKTISSVSATPPLSPNERRALRRKHGTRLPLVLVLLSLALAVLLPRLMQRRIAHLRDVAYLAEPARLRIARLQLDLVVESAARRGYLLPGYPDLANQLGTAQMERRSVERQLLADARRLDVPPSVALTRAVENLQDLGNRLDSLGSASGIRPQASAALAEQEQCANEIHALSDSLESRVARATESRRASMGQTEDVVGLLTAGLVLIGLGAAFLVARLGSHYRKLALRLDETEARFRQIADNLCAVVWLSEPDMRRQLYVSVAYERIWGRSRESLETDPNSFMEGVHPDDRERVRASLADLAHRAADVEFRVVRPDGTVRWVWSRGFPVRDNSGRIFRVAGIMEDVTERHEYVLERDTLLAREQDARAVAERRQSALERVTDSRGRLIRGFTHDVKNPLGAADGYLALLEEGTFGTLVETQRETLARARRSIHHALELIGQLLEVARAEAGQVEIHQQKTDVVEVVRDVADSFRKTAEAKGLALAVELPERPPTVMTDASRLRQVVDNLVSNAVKYTPAGGHVSVNCCESSKGVEQAAPQVVITVSDDGGGIPKDKLPMLFMEYKRFSPEAAAGEGIGLAISQKIAEALGGEITVDSKVGLGSTFALRLPVAPSRHPTQP